MYKHYRLTTPDGLDLCLYRREEADDSHIGRKPVLLLHGASANHRTFVTPNGGIAKWLTEGRPPNADAFEPFDVWLLDWRASSEVVTNTSEELLEQAAVFSFNAAARFDIRCALDRITQTVQAEGARPPLPITAVGFCMGGAILAEAIAGGCVTPTEIDCVALMAMALFYETPIDGRLKSEERVLERLKGTSINGPAHRRFFTMDPRVKGRIPDGPFELETPWPTELEDFYTTWPQQLRFHLHDRRTTVDETCNRLSFMLGMFYEHENLEAVIHDPGEDCLDRQFGPMALNLFIHGARNVRGGHATFYPDPPQGKNDGYFVSDQARRRFTPFDNVTLITGARNRLWHRDSIDRMHEWLCRDPENRARFQKHVLENYGHQDLMWGRDSARDVFPLVERALRTA